MYNIIMHSKINIFFLKLYYAGLLKFVGMWSIKKVVS